MLPQSTSDGARAGATAPSPRAPDTSAPPDPALSGSDLLLWSALPDLTLNIAQTAALCGVSVRQLGYWTKQGYVTATGAGARRLYGPEALRRILAIRQAMQNGLSLRQALRALASAPPARHAPPPPAPAAPGPDNAAAVAADLLSLFERDRHVQDSASGLAAKLGRRTDDVRRAAEALSAQGALARHSLEDEVVFARAGETV